jgi:hypothetical protein
MAQFRYVYTSFWEDPKVVENFTPEDKFFFIYLLTNPHTTQIGIYKITKKLISFELGYSIESVNSLMSRFEEHHKVIRYNEETRELAIKNWGKFNLRKGGKPVVDCIIKEFKSVEDKSLIAYVAGSIANPSIKFLFMEELKKYSISVEENVPKTVDELCNTPDDTSHDTPAIRGQKENKKEKENKNIDNIYSQKIDEKNHDLKELHTDNGNIPYEKIVQEFNDICISMPRVQKISKQRKIAIKSRWREYGSVDIFSKVFKMAESSNFLSGRDGKWCSCSFDWIMKSQNFIKVMEGNYRNRQPIRNRSKFNNFKEREYDFDELEKKLLGYT